MSEGYVGEIILNNTNRKKNYFSIMAKTILKLSSEEAVDYMLKSRQFCGFELPEYFDFDEVLNYVRNTIGDKSYEDCLAGTIPDELANVNLDILKSKDGRYAVRPLMLANPYLYYFLTREVCGATGWEAVKKCFEAYKVPNIMACALPVVPFLTESFYKSTTILNWWNSMEQRSIELSLEYKYMFATDITNCYGTINPQSIEWALNCRGTKHENNSNTTMASNIQKYLRAMQHGNNIGIPQGSELFDLIAEIVLGYSDLMLYEALEKKGITEYKILRYRDDYRIFCNDRDTLEKISYTLQEVLLKLNFNMNSQKTKLSSSIVTDSIKPDKLWYIYNTPIVNGKRSDFASFQKHLLYILMFSRDYPNSGQIRTMLSDIDNRLRKWIKKMRDHKMEIIEVFGWDDEDEADNEERQKDFLKTLNNIFIPGGSIRAMVAVATQIAIENVSATHYALLVISRLIDSLSDEEEKQDIIDMVYNRLRNQPNSAYNQLWLQNMTYTYDKARDKSPYDLRLCQLVAGKEVEPLWNNDWLTPELTTALPYDSIVNKETLKKVGPVITFKETRDYLENREKDIYDHIDIPDIDWDEFEELVAKHNQQNTPEISSEDAKAMIETAKMLDNMTEEDMKKATVVKTYGLDDSDKDKK